MTVLPYRTVQERQRALPTLRAHLLAGGLIAYPTETVYGFGGLITPEATYRLRELKRRDVARPFIMLLREPSQATGVVWNDVAILLAQQFWPGPLTLALPASGDTLPEGLVSPDGLVAVRATPHEGARAVIEAAGAVTSTSANAPGGAPAASAAEVQRALEALGADDVLVLDGGPLPPSPPSTLLACDARQVRVLREGAISRESIRKRLQGSGIDVD